MEKAEFDQAAAVIAAQRAEAQPEQATETLNSAVQVVKFQVSEPTPPQPAESEPAPAPPQATVVTPSETQEEFAKRVAAMAQPPPPAAKRTKVAILGFVQHFKLAPFDDPSFEIWGLNELYDHIPRWDRWFEIHDRSIYENDRNRTSQHIQKLKAMKCPVYMHRHWDDIPASVEYPMQAVCQAFPNPCPEARPYINNSITYMILLAILEGFQEVHIYGVDMAHDTEYRDQRPSCEWAVGIAQGRAIKVYVPAQSDLLKTTYLYGYEQEPALAFDRKMLAREQEFEANIGKLDQEIGRLSEVRAQYRGAHQDTQHWRKNWKSQHQPSTS